MSSGPLKHHKHGPSSLQYKEQCAKWASDPTGNEAADEGTMLHNACETGDWAKLDTEQQQSVRYCVNYTEHLIRKLNA